MTRRFLLGLAFLSLAATAHAAEKRPNILYILADDWGWGDLGCYGNPRLKTPNLDALARQGTLLTQYYQCGSVCSPSRTAQITGRYPSRFGVHGHFATNEQNQKRGMPNWLDPEAVTLAKLLKTQGYTTAHFGKWHLGGVGAPLPDRYGYDVAKIGAAGPVTDSSFGTVNSRPRSTELIVDETIKFLEQIKAKPFFAQAWLLDTHAILNPSPEALAAYPELQVPGIPFTSPARVYAAAATAADAQLGRLFKKLDELGLRENTIVIFTSDNGPEAIEIANASHSGVGSPGPFRGRKRSLYEGGVRLPFIVRGPGVPAGAVNDAIVAGVDILPTLAAISGATVPESLALDGEDRASVLRGKAPERTRPLHWEWRFGIAGHPWNRSPILSIREGRWKLLLNPDGSRVELYDIPKDPGESDNVADQHPELVSSLSAQALAWQKTLPPGPFDPTAGQNAYPWPKATP
ncbi:sulfatase-like hydrolase/transferase [Singulisphaera sp. Ch08]|uniref:Sulfatase-like hydrolase/transferase n=1 Tax=Singulisphaera sp. Ch08 TaxID=3120278 RepID=A0AAU7CIU5_9BACT